MPGTKPSTPYKMPRIPTLPGELAFYCGTLVADEKTNAEGVTGTHLGTHVSPHSQRQGTEDWNQAAWFWVVL